MTDRLLDVTPVSGGSAWIEGEYRYRLDRWWGPGITVVNLFARRCTRPVHLKDPGDPVGPHNDNAILAGALEATTVAAWGAHPIAARRGQETAQAITRVAGADVWCLGTTKDGSPRHPLYVKGDAELVRWP